MPRYRKRPKAFWVTPEGYPYIAVGLLLTLLAGYYAGGWAALLAGGFTVYLALFFRNPPRRVPPEENWITAPADGRVLEIVDGEEGRYLRGPARRISIFMSPLNCHLNRAPVSGKIERCFYQKGKFKAAFRKKSMEQNEHHAILLKDERGRAWLVVQIAGWLARRIVSYVREGEHLNRGERFGLIQFGSRTDLYCPPGCEIVVRKGQKVLAGKTVLGRMP
ncbi:MAG: phosphatidylserine decarboxylase family protein [Deltaproteobacteria bacterium]|nr:phosphatidylserine decarboxylase family protein [Deltaproteobacteria bacterium]MBI4224620.1 phosphatidylserine decarboxylase family protein [Deltaproteobacteria bacterium]